LINFNNRYLILRSTHELNSPKKNEDKKKIRIGIGITFKKIKIHLKVTEALRGRGGGLRRPR
jgi:hypothetical protein